MSNLIAIDPGAAGGIAWSLYGQVKCVKMPDTQPDILSVLREIDTCRNSQQPMTCYIEDLPKYVGENVPSSAIGVMFCNFGFILGCLQALGIRTIMVTPQKWQKALGLGTKGLQKASKTAGLEERAAIRRYNEQAKRDWKAKLRSEAQRRFPHLAATLKTSDSLLILEFAKLAENVREVEKATPL